MLSGEQQGASSPEESQLKQLFSELSYAMLEGKMPTIAPNILSFKVLEVDLDKRRGVGVFKAKVGQNTASIPIVMNDGKVLTPEVIYSDKSKTYLPLKNNWMEELKNPSENYLGKSAKAPKTLSSDMDVRALTLPPSTGRFVYASYDRSSLPFIIDSASDSAKTKLASAFKSSPNLLKTAVKYHGSRIITALQPSIKKEAEASSTVVVLGPEDSFSSFEDGFGSAIKEAYSMALHEGVVTRDLRPRAKVAVDTTSTLSISKDQETGLSEPKYPGLYSLMTSSGKQEKVVIIPKPFTQVSLEAGSSEMGSNKSSYLILRPTGRYTLHRGDLLAISDNLPLPEGSKLSKAILRKSPPQNGANLFVGVNGVGVTNAVVLEEPLTKVTKNVSGYTAFSGGTKVIITSSKGVSIPKRVEGVLYIPSKYVAFKGTKTSTLDNLITTPEELSSLVEKKLTNLSDDVIKVSFVRSGNYWVLNGSNYDTKKDLLTKAASYNINVDSLRKSLERIKEAGATRMYLVDPIHINKLASIFGPDPSTPPPPPPPPGMDPNMMPPPGMGPNMMPPPPPPGGMPPETTQTMEAAMGTGSQEAFDSAVAGSLLQEDPFNESLATELPNIESAMDSIAKILVTLQLRNSELKEQMGEEDFFQLETNMRKVLGGLGDIILSTYNQKRMDSLPQVM